MKRLNTKEIYHCRRGITHTSPNDILKLSDFDSDDFKSLGDGGFKRVHHTEDEGILNGR